LDYKETFSFVVKFDSIRTILSIAVVENMDSNQFYVSMAFLYSKIDKQIFLGQPLSFLDEEHPTQICQLLKALYGLKQFLQVWNCNFLTTHHFLPSIANPFGYVSNIDPRWILCIFVDDNLACSIKTNKIARILVR